MFDHVKAHEIEQKIKKIKKGRRRKKQNNLSIDISTKVRDIQEFSIH